YKRQPEGVKVQYVLDGQQRITSLFAAYLGAHIQKVGEKKTVDYSSIVVNLGADINDNDEQVITAEPTGDNYISLSDVLNFMDRMTDIKDRFSDQDFKKIHSYSRAFDTYDFSTVILRKEDIDSAIEVFTRINTGGQTLTLFEIMSAKTYDEQQQFDMQVKWENFIKELKEIKYEGVSSSVVLSLLALLLSRTKECKRKTILSLDKQNIIDSWDGVVSALKDSVDYFRTTYRIPVSQLLPYDSLLVPFSYFFYQNKDKPNADQRKYLEEFFWRVSLSSRYSSSTESKLAQDIKRIDQILKGQRPDYNDIKVNLDSPQSLIDTNFSACNSYCKAVLCLLAYQEPKDFQDNGKVILDNSWLKVANSKNYHHFFPKAYLKNRTVLNGNSVINITFVSDHLNKRKIGAKAPSQYMADFQDENSQVNKALQSHLIDLDGFGIESNDYDTFLQARAKLIYEELRSRIDLSHKEPVNEEVQELILAGESDTVEFKSTLRYDLRTKEVNKKLEYVIGKTIAAFMNSDGGNLFIGVDDNQNMLGLIDDISTLSKPNIDGFELHLIEIIKKYIGAGLMAHIKISFPEVEGTQICRIKISKSSKPVFTQYEGREDFFIRSGCSSQPLSREDQSAYERSHWN
ncbi:MAG: putative DNA binding domain-containing protein, partial [Hydrogenovibrio crunogenus]|nr:putative DNA binding domain-containing protein [Hydrogenovibrio crunogenus]